MPLNTIRSTIIEIYVDNANVKGKENIYACMHLLDLQTFGAWDMIEQCLNVVYCSLHA